MAPDFGPFTNLSRFRATDTDRFQASCPMPAHLHGDRSRGLSGRIFGTKIVLKCFSGCETAAILRTMGLDWSALFADGECVPRRHDPVADRKIHAAERLRGWRETETQRLGKELRNRDRLARSANDMVNSGELSEDGAWNYLELAYQGYSEFENRWQMLVNDRQHPDTLTLWRESRNPCQKPS